MSLSGIVKRTGQIFEIYGDNRSGKGVFAAVLAWDSYLAGDQVWANCPKDPITGAPDHIYNFPHEDYDPAQLFFLRLHDVTVVTDESDIFMDSAYRTQTSRNLYHFGYQVKKRGIKWIYSTVRIKNIEFRVRTNPDFGIETVRYPRDARKPLIAVKLVITPRFSSHDRTVWLRNKRLPDGGLLFQDGIFKLYNHDVMVTPQTVRAITPSPSK